MRPDPSPDPSDASSRIIYIGDVRRRKNRNGSPDRKYLAALAVAASVGWCIWCAVLLSLPPTRLLSYLAFFAPLFLALAASCALAAYVADWRMGHDPVLRTSVRRGTIAACFIVLSLILLASHHWSLVTAGATLLAAVGGELALSRRFH